MTLKYITIEAKKPPAEYLLVALHGWGADAQDLAGLANYLELPNFKMLFPDAPFSHYQLPNGKAWYALETENFQNLPEARKILEDWLLSLPTITGIPLEKTFLLGFSQGGAMTLDIGVRLPLAGLCSLSGYLHGTLVKGQKSPEVLIIHGKYDPVVKLELAQKAREELIKLGANVEYHEIDMAHEIPLEVLPIIGKFLKKY